MKVWVSIGYLLDAFGYLLGPYRGAEGTLGEVWRLQEDGGAILDGPRLPNTAYIITSELFGTHPFCSICPACSSPPNPRRGRRQGRELSRWPPERRTSCAWPWWWLPFAFRNASKAGAALDLPSRSGETKDGSTRSRTLTEDRKTISATSPRDGGDHLAREGRLAERQLTLDAYSVVGSYLIFGFDFGLRGWCLRAATRGTNPALKKSTLWKKHAGRFTEDDSQRTIHRR